MQHTIESDGGNQAGQSHHPIGHQLTSFAVSHSEKDHQKREEPLAYLNVEDTESAENERDGEHTRRDDRGFAPGLDETDGASDFQQGDVDPKNDVLIHK